MNMNFNFNVSFVGWIIIFSLCCSILLTWVSSMFILVKLFMTFSFVSCGVGVFGVFVIDDDRSFYDLVELTFYWLFVSVIIFILSLVL